MTDFGNFSNIFKWKYAVYTTALAHFILINEDYFNLVIFLFIHRVMMDFI